MARLLLFILFSSVLSASRPLDPQCSHLSDLKQKSAQARASGLGPVFTEAYNRGAREKKEAPALELSVWAFPPWGSEEQAVRLETYNPALGLAYRSLAAFQGSAHHLWFRNAAEACEKNGKWESAAHYLELEDHPRTKLSGLIPAYEKILGLYEKAGNAGKVAEYQSRIREAQAIQKISNLKDRADRLFKLGEHELAGYAYREIADHVAAADAFRRAHAHIPAWEEIQKYEKDPELLARAMMLASRPYEALKLLRKTRPNGAPPLDKYRSDVFLAESQWLQKQGLLAVSFRHASLHDEHFPKYIQLLRQSGFETEAARLLLTKGMPDERAISDLEKAGMWGELALYYWMHGQRGKQIHTLAELGAQRDAADLAFHDRDFATAEEQARKANRPELVARVAWHARKDPAPFLSLAGDYEKQTRWNDAAWIYREIGKEDLAELAEEKQRERLRSGKVKEAKLIAHGKTLAFFVTLDNGQKAVFKPNIEGVGGGRYEIATARLAHLLGYPHVPVSIEIEIDGVRGLLQTWVDDAVVGRDTAMGPDEVGDLGFIDYLRSNSDRHRGNYLMRDGVLIAIDNVTAFQALVDAADLEKAKVRGTPSPNFLNRLRALKENQIDEVFRDVLTPQEIVALKIRIKLLASSFP